MDALPDLPAGLSSPQPQAHVNALLPGSAAPAPEMFENRLRKRLKWLLPWAKQRGVEAYRLYDHDIPEVRLAVERYADTLVVHSYFSADEETSRLLPLLEVLYRVLQTPKDRVFVKTHARQKGKAQYGKFDAAQVERVITENGHRFLVNLSDYLDTGLFLDHRDARALVGRLASGRRVLNLFGYTGSFSVYAARGFALSSLTVDLSATYLRWAARNFQLNGLNLSRHRLVRADAVAWLRDPGVAPQIVGPFDFILCDPPTFSNSQKMHGTFCVTRDHEWLLSRAARFLSPQGLLLFSTNKRGFQLCAPELPGFVCRDLSSTTLPRDFHTGQTRTGRSLFLFEPRT